MYAESTLRVIVLWVLFSLGLWKLSAKLNWKYRWMAWIPGLRYGALGQSLHMTREGILCGGVEILIYVLNLMLPYIQTEKISTALNLLVLILIVLLFVYRIRFFVRLMRVFGLKKRWILLWLLSEWLTMLIIGFGKKYQPKRLPGSGKTTLVNAMIGYEKAEAKVTLNGADIYRDYGQMKYRFCLD